MGIYHKKILEVKRGDEYRTKIERDFKETDIFDEIYVRAMKILNEIIEEEENFSKERMENKGFSKGFHGMSNNIILFCADRGQGKTSAMLSFARVLKNRSEKSNRLFKLDNKEFYVLDSIDPSVLDNEESIIRVIISRLFYILKETVESEKLLNNVQFRQEKERILELFQKCYENIEYLQNRKNVIEYQDDLEYLAQLGDSSKLKENLYELIERFLENTKMENDIKNRFLVIPIDDADLSIQGVFRICEDIRKYLSIPNVIILMAANFEQINFAIYQNYLLQYKTINEIKSDETGIEIKCREMAARYLEKMFPSGHCLELPKIEEIIRKQSYSLKLAYIVSGKNVFESWNEECTDIQEELLRLVYSKTGVVFLKGEGQLNPFLPQTLRELTHFVKLFNDMEKVDMKVVSQKLGVLTKTEEQQKNIQQEWKKLKLNMQLLKQYFFNYWCLNHLKISEQQKMNDLDKMDFNSIKKSFKDALIEEDDLHTAIRLYYTIFINEWFVEGLDKHEQLGELADFVISLLLKERNEDTRNWREYKIDGFDIEYAKMKECFPMDKLDSREISLLGKWCSVSYRENYNGARTLITKKEKWNKNITTIRFEMLRPLMASIGMSDVLLENKTPDEKNKEKEESSNNFSMEKNTSEETMVEQAGQYITGIKDVVADYGLWCSINNVLEEKYEEIKEEENLKWNSTLRGIYEEVDNVYNYKLKYLAINHLNSQEVIINRFPKEFWNKIFLFNNENSKKYLEDGELAFKTWFDDVLVNLDLIIENEENNESEKIDENEKIKQLKDLMKLVNTNFSKDLVIEWTSKIEDFMQSNMLTSAEAVEEKVKKLINKLGKEVSQDSQEMLEITNIRNELEEYRK